MPDTDYTVEQLQNFLEYEIHKGKEAIRTFRIAYSQKLKRRLTIEVEGMLVTLKHVEEPWKSKLLRRISNIEEVLNNESNES